ncbi:hypothetical protein AX16_002259 [Volvariella volvacea WC 439]|nr:hypothetical protein AX16_002259 [Volvariella volvacea WC 439]
MHKSRRGMTKSSPSPLSPNWVPNAHPADHEDSTRPNTSTNPHPQAQDTPTHPVAPAARQRVSHSNLTQPTVPNASASTPTLRTHVDRALMRSGIRRKHMPRQDSYPPPSSVLFDTADPQVETKDVEETSIKDTKGYNDCDKTMRRSNTATQQGTLGASTPGAPRSAPLPLPEIDFELVIGETEDALN